METLPLPRSSDAAGATFTAFPAKDGEDRAIVDEAITGHLGTVKLLSKCLGIIGKTQWVEASTGVDHLTKWSTGNTVALNSTHQDDLSCPNGQDALGVDQAWVAQVVKSTLAKDLSSSLEPHSLAELDTVASQQLWEDASESSKHGPPAVDHLKLTILGEGFWVS
ncbi:LOW QUALITY PROTEIN: hypothetical protein RJ640_030040 [Escallonia rubra]|uniref:Uncharacterized protein n=1 Tax=Escallonia rubra TaxID=112253 RepID=A0AA88UV40_9ASTE|nr:LOW QUALITY PROTEIN: hypothetical protein RJ640_030040 [Escallonia rubra]